MIKCIITAMKWIIVNLSYCSLYPTCKNMCCTRACPFIQIVDHITLFIVLFYRGSALLENKNLTLVQWIFFFVWVWFLWLKGQSMKFDSWLNIILSIDETLLLNLQSLINTYWYLCITCEILCFQKKFNSVK